MSSYPSAKYPSSGTCTRWPATFIAHFTVFNYIHVCPTSLIRIGLCLCLTFLRLPPPIALSCPSFFTPFLRNGMRSVHCQHFKRKRVSARMSIDENQSRRCSRVRLLTCTLCKMSQSMYGTADVRKRRVGGCVTMVRMCWTRKQKTCKKCKNVYVEQGTNTQGILA